MSNSISRVIVVLGLLWLLGCSIEVVRASDIKDEMEEAIMENKIDEIEEKRKCIQELF